MIKSKKMQNVKSAILVLRVPAAEFAANAPEGLKAFFNKYGEVKPAVQSTSPPAGPRQKGVVTLQPTPGCSLERLFKGFDVLGLRTFAASRKEEGDVICLKFMMCADDEVVQDGRPGLKEAHAACRAACSMASFGVMTYNNPYIKEGAQETDRAWSVNGNKPVWGGSCLHVLRIESGELVVD